MKTNVLLLLFCALSCATTTAHARVIPNFDPPPECAFKFVSKDDVQRLPDTVTLLQVVEKFGQGCVVGSAAVTLQYKSRDKGISEIWFWMENAPTLASKKIGNAAKQKKPVDLPLLFAEYRVNHVAQAVLWPSKYVGHRPEDVFNELIAVPTIRLMDEAHTTGVGKMSVAEASAFASYLKKNGYSDEGFTEDVNKEVVDAMLGRGISGRSSRTQVIDESPAALAARAASEAADSSDEAARLAGLDFTIEHSNSANEDVLEKMRSAEEAWAEFGKARRLGDFRAARSAQLRARTASAAELSAFDRAMEQSTALHKELKELAASRISRRNPVDSNMVSRSDDQSAVTDESE